MQCSKIQLASGSGRGGHATQGSRFGLGYFGKVSILETYIYIDTQCYAHQHHQKPRKINTKEKQKIARNKTTKFKEPTKTRKNRNTKKTRKRRSGKDPTEESQKPDSARERRRDRHIDSQTETQSREGENECSGNTDQRGVGRER